MAQTTPVQPAKPPSTRPAALQGFVDALRAAFDQANLSPAGRQAVDKVFAATAKTAPSHTPLAVALPVAALFAEALAPLLPRTDALGTLARALRDLAPQLKWSTRKIVGPTASPDFARAHANAFLLGPGGMEDRGDLWIGLSLMAPETRYPDHDHAAEEVYLVLTPGEFWHGDAAWISPGVGGTVHNVPGIRHAMRALDQPFLAVWVLPI